jgi:hypothetical protein
MAISLLADACLRAATMGEPAGTLRTTDDDAFPFFPLAPDDAEGAASDATAVGTAPGLGRHLKGRSRSRASGWSTARSRRSASSDSSALSRPAASAACMLPAILATTTGSVSYPFFFLDAGTGGLGWSIVDAALTPLASR